MRIPKQNSSTIANIRLITASVTWVGGSRQGNIPIFPSSATRSPAPDCGILAFDPIAGLSFKMLAHTGRAPIKTVCETVETGNLDIG